MDKILVPHGIEDGRRAGVQFLKLLREFQDDDGKEDTPASIFHELAKKHS